jgi:hypothetical protein
VHLREGDMREGDRGCDGCGAEEDAVEESSHSLLRRLDAICWAKSHS